jgi:hypothetical protein
MAKRKRKMRRMVDGVNLVINLTKRWRMIAGDFNSERNP